MVSTTHSCIRLTRIIGKRLLQVVIFYIENFMNWMPCRVFRLSCMWSTKTQINLTMMLVTSVSFEMMTPCTSDSSLWNAIINASDICSKNVKMQLFKMEYSSTCPNLIVCVGSLGSANRIYLCTGSIMKRSRSLF